MDGVEVSRFGPAALLVQFSEKIDLESLARCRGLMNCLDKTPMEGLVEVTPAYCSLLLEFDDPKHVSQQFDKLDELLKSARAQPAEEASLFEIPVRYDGPDIDEFARRNTLSVSDVIELHSAACVQCISHRLLAGLSVFGSLGFPSARSAIGHAACACASGFGGDWGRAYRDLQHRLAGRMVVDRADEHGNFLCFKGA